jgi:hypothetical protein
MVVVLTTLEVFLPSVLGAVLMTRLPRVRTGGDAGARPLVGTTLTTPADTGAFFLFVGVIGAHILPWASLLGAEELSQSSGRVAVLIVFVSGSLSIPARDLQAPGRRGICEGDR